MRLNVGYFTRTFEALGLGCFEYVESDQDKLDFFLTYAKNYIVELVYNKMKETVDYKILYCGDGERDYNIIDDFNKHIESKKDSIHRDMLTALRFGFIE